MSELTKPTPSPDTPDTQACWIVCVRPLVKLWNVNAVWGNMRCSGASKRRLQWAAMPLNNCSRHSMIGWTKARNRSTVNNKLFSLIHPTDYKITFRGNRRNFFRYDRFDFYGHGQFQII